MASQNEESVISDIPRLSPLHFSPRSAEDKLRLFEAIHKRGSIVDSIESNLEQVNQGIPKGGSITVPLTSYLTGLESAV